MDNWIPIENGNLPNYMAVVLITNTLGQVLEMQYTGNENLFSYGSGRTYIEHEATAWQPLPKAYIPAALGTLPTTLSFSDWVAKQDSINDAGAGYESLTPLAKTVLNDAVKRYCKLHLSATPAPVDSVRVPIEQMRRWEKQLLQTPDSYAAWSFDVLSEIQSYINNPSKTHQ